MTRAITLILSFFLLTGTAYPIDLLPEHRVHNIGNYCGFASLDTLAHVHDIDSLKGCLQRVRQWDIDQKHKYVTVCYDYVMRDYLGRRNIPFRISNQWSFDRTILEEYANTHGVAVALKSGNPHSIGCHMIVITSYDDKEVKFYDSSKPLDKEGKPKTWTCSRDWFQKWWLGNSVVVFRDKETTE